MNIFWSIILILSAILVLKIILIAMIFKREIDAAFERDPAAINRLEVILTYSGLHAIIAHRIANAFLRWHIPILPRAISQMMRHWTGIEIHPGARIGRGLFIDHGMGVVIGETSIIGDNVTLFQGVTLGGTGKHKGKRHPTLGDNVVVGAGAKILGNITIGDNVNVGANAVVVKDVPSDSTVVGVPGRIVKKEGRKFTEISLDHTDLPDPVSQALERLQKEVEFIERHMKGIREKHNKNAGESL